MNSFLEGWRILSAVDQIIPGESAKTRAEKWDSDYSFELLMLEMMAQTGGLVVGSVRDFEGNVVFAKVEGAEFSEAPGSGALTVEAFARDGVSEQGSWIEAQVFCGAQKCAAAKFFLIDAGDLDASRKSLTFHPEFLEYYQVREKIRRDYGQK